MKFNIPSLLENDKVILYPLQETDFEALYKVASDPAIWEQHPNKDRWQKDVFCVFFNGAMASEGAFKIIDKITGEIAGSTRLYDYDEKSAAVLIGYTFYATKYWGTGINRSVKGIMLNYAFQFVNTVYFHVGATNIRSQIAIQRLGAVKTGEQEVAYFGERSKLNFIYCLSKSEWKAANR